MQDEFSCTPATTRALETALSTPRLRRYAPAARDDPNLTLRLYIWNARLCEAFYLPCQIAEVTCRNTIITALRERYGVYWYVQERLVSTLPNRLRDELNRVAIRARLEKDPSMVADYVVSGLTFGFWLHLMTKGFDFTLGKDGISAYFPHSPDGTLRTDIYRRIDQIRLFRNRIAHHKAIFDKRPMAEYNNILVLIGWIGHDIRWFLGQAAIVSRVINARPRAR